MTRAKDVDEYIQKAPRELQERISAVRAAIKKAAPKAEEKISYGMPYYGYKGRLVYFALAKKHIGLYIPPPIIEDHKNELTDYVTATSAVQFPLDQDLPTLLIKKLVTARVKWNDKSEKMKKGKAWKICSRGHKYQGSGPCPACWPGYKKVKK